MDPFGVLRASARVNTGFQLPSAPMPATPLSDPLSRALDDAIAGRRAALFELLARGSRLPGPRAHSPLADAFAQACRTRGAAADALALAMARLTADEAPGATALEFLPLCGVLAIAYRAAADEAIRSPLVTELHAHADDLRFRVREAVIDGLARIGSTAGDALIEEVAPWMDGYFHAAAVLRALAQEPWLTNLHDAGRVVVRLDEAFELACDAPRAAARYPGHKALLDALRATPPRVAIRFGVPVFDMWTRWATTADPVLRELLRTALRDAKLVGRFRSELDRVRHALDASEPPARNPDHDHGPSRDRSGGRRRTRVR
jgi:hypothetical protein